MTKTALIAEIAQRLGDSSGGFLTTLGNIFDQVLRELASRGCLKQSQQTATFTFTTGTMNYATRTITGITTPDYPLDIVSLIIPALQELGRLTRVEDEEFVRWRLAYTDSAGVAIAGVPRVWRLYPNETQLQVLPVPEAGYTTQTVEVAYIKPPTLLAGGDSIQELRQEHIPYLLAGCVKYGAVFQDETRMDVRTAISEFELGMRYMRAEAQRQRGRAIQGVYRDV